MRPSLRFLGARRLGRLRAAFALIPRRRGLPSRSLGQAKRGLAAPLVHDRVSADRPRADHGRDGSGAGLPPDLTATVTAIRRCSRPGCRSAHPVPVHYAAQSVSVPMPTPPQPPSTSRRNRHQLSMPTSRPIGRSALLAACIPVAASANRASCAGTKHARASAPTGSIVCSSAAGLCCAGARAALGPTRSPAAAKLGGSQAGRSPDLCFNRRRRIPAHHQRRRRSRRRGCRGRARAAACQHPIWVTAERRQRLGQMRQRPQRLRCVRRGRSLPAADAMGVQPRRLSPGRVSSA